MNETIWLVDENGKKYREVSGMPGVFVGEYGFKPIDNLHNKK